MKNCNKNTVLRLFFKVLEWPQEEPLIKFLWAEFITFFVLFRASIRLQGYGALYSFLDSYISIFCSFFSFGSLVSEINKFGMASYPMIPRKEDGIWRKRHWKISFSLISFKHLWNKYNQNPKRMKMYIKMWKIMENVPSKKTYNSLIEKQEFLQRNFTLKFVAEILTHLMCTKHIFNG